MGCRCPAVHLQFLIGNTLHPTYRERSQSHLKLIKKIKKSRKDFIFTTSSRGGREGKRHRFPTTRPTDTQWRVGCFSEASILNNTISKLLKDSPVGEYGEILE